MGDLPKAFDDAHALIRHASLSDNLDVGVDGVYSCAQRLSQWLHMQQGVPVAVGSARASLRHKARAIVHSQRLESASWPSAARLLNSTATWTGDLGTESGLWRMRTTVPELFGTWVIEDESFDDQAFDFHDRPESEYSEELSFSCA